MAKGAVVRLTFRCASVAVGLFALLFLLAGNDSPTPVTATPLSSSYQPIDLVRLCKTTFPSGGAPTVCTGETLTTAANPDYSTQFYIPWGHYNFSSLTTSTPTAGTITAGGGLPLGSIVGKLRSSTTLGLANATCAPGASNTYVLEVNFTFMSATVDTTATIDSLSNAAAGAEGALEPYRDDIDVPSTGPNEAGNGLPAHVDGYPSFLNKIFDPTRIGDMNLDGDELDTMSEAAAESAANVNQDLNGDGDQLDGFDLNADGDITDSIDENTSGTTDAIAPLVRYSGATIVAGTAVTLEFVIFSPGVLQAAFPPPNPFSDLYDSMGYTSITVLNDPTQALAPSAISDFCAPLASYTLLYGMTRDNPCTAAGVGSANQCNDTAAASCDPCLSNAPKNSPDVCANTVDDDGDTVVNDGCPLLILAEAGVNCGDGIDNDGDLYVDDGCPAAGPGPTAESACATCDEGIKTAGGEGGSARYANPAVAGTYYYYALTQSLPDADGDGFENGFDSCQRNPNTDDGRKTNGADADMLDPACDPNTINLGAGNFDGDGTIAGGQWSNGQDNCSVFTNSSQGELDLNLPRTLSTPNGGPLGDTIGDACEGAEDGNTECGNALDDDGDLKFNDGCPKVGALAETGANCNNSTNEDSADDTGEAGGPGNRVNDGCPAVDPTGEKLVSNGHFHSIMEIIAKCIGAAGSDDDGDGYCDTTETTLVSAPGATATGGESDQSGTGAEGATGGVAGAGPQCNNSTDDDGDGFINDGCPAAGAEFDGPPGGVAQCQNATDNDGDTFVNDGCFAVGRGNCRDGLNNDSPADADTDSADTGCRTPEHATVGFPTPLVNWGSGDGTPPIGAEVKQPCNDGVDNDADGSTDGADTGCNDFDQDGDGYSDDNEVSLGTGPTDPCGNNGWPNDLDPTNSLGIGDFNSFTFPLAADDGHGTFAYFGHTVPDAGRVNEARWNLVVDGSISIGDLNAMSPAVGAPSSRPPMFGGPGVPADATTASFGRTCPFPP